MARWVALRASLTLQRGASAVPTSTFPLISVRGAPVQQNQILDQLRHLADGPRTTRRTKRKAKKVRKAVPKAEEELNASAAGAGEANSEAKEEESSDGGGFLSDFRKQMAEEMKRMEEETEATEAKVCVCDALQNPASPRGVQFVLWRGGEQFLVLSVCSVPCLSLFFHNNLNRETGVRRVLAQRWLSVSPGGVAYCPLNSKRWPTSSARSHRSPTSPLSA